MDCGPPGSSVHGILPARILEWVAMPSSRGSSQPRDPTRISCSSCIAGGFFTAEPPGKSYFGYSTFQILLVRGVFRCLSERMLSIIWYILPIPAPLICCLWSQIWSLFLWVLSLDSTYKRYHVVFAFPCLKFHLPWCPQGPSSSVQSLSHVRLCDPMNRSTPGLPAHHQLLEPTQIHVHWVSVAIQPSHSLLSPSPPAFNLTQHQGLFQWVNSSHEVAKYCSFSFNISPSNEHPGLIYFRMDWLYLLAVQGTLKSLLQHHSSKAFFGISYWQYISIFVSNIFKIFL